MSTLRRRVWPWRPYRASAGSAASSGDVKGFPSLLRSEEGCGSAASEPRAGRNLLRNGRESSLQARGGPRVAFFVGTRGGRLLSSSPAAWISIPRRREGFTKASRRLHRSRARRQGSVAHSSIMAIAMPWAQPRAGSELAWLVELDSNSTRRPETVGSSLDDGLKESYSLGTKPYKARGRNVLGQPWNVS